MKTRTLVILGAVLLACFSRVIQYWNFAPMTAMALFAAATLTDRKLGVFVPLLALFASDLCIEVLHRYGVMPTWGIYEGMWATYLATFLIALMGLALRKHRTVPNIAGMTLAGSLVFFIVSDLGVWLPGTLYPLTVRGLIACYVAAIPFLKNSLLGDAVYATALFGGFALVEMWIPALRTQPTVAEPVATRA
jgi:hypothetical protein